MNKMISLISFYLENPQKMIGNQKELRLSMESKQWNSQMNSITNSIATKQVNSWNPK
jgi:hypothetical protein